MAINLIIKAVIVGATIALNMARKIEGPRLDDLKFSGGDAGQPWPNIWGKRRTFGVPIWGLDLEEVHQRRKTKGGKFNDYTYFERSAYGVAGHEIDAVSRVWADKHLVLDLTGAGPVSPYAFTSSTGGKGGGGGSAGAGAFLASDYFAIYKGTPGQDPDPYMQSFVEAELGAGWCPAYRNRAYIVIKRLPVEKFGNRRPQYEFEVIRNSTPAYPTATPAITGQALKIQFSPDHSLMLVTDGTSFNVIDVAAGSVATSGTLSPPSLYRGVALISDGTMYGLPTEHELDVYSIDSGAGTFSRYLHDFGDDSDQSALNVVTDADGVEHYIGSPFYATGYTYLDGGFINTTLLTGDSWVVATPFADLDGGVWICGRSNTKAHFLQVVGGSRYVVISGLPAGYGGGIGAAHYRDADVDQIVFNYSGGYYAWDFNTEALTLSLPAPSYPVYNVGGVVGASTAWAGFYEYSLKDLTLVRTVLPANYGSGIATTTGTTYDPVNHALIVGGTSLAIFYLDRVGSPGIVLGDIVSEIAATLGVVNYDFSDLDQTVLGWSSTQGQASSILEPLLDAFDSDIRPHGFAIEGIKRSGVSALTIDVSEFVAASPRYALGLRAPGTFPLQLVYNFADVDKEQQPNNARSLRHGSATGAAGERTVDLSTLAETADGARNKADRHFRRLIAERQDLTNSLTAQYRALEPGDVVTLTLDGAVVDNWRLKRLTFKADDTQVCNWAWDHASLAVLGTATGAVMEGIREASIAVPLLSKGFVLDTPYITDADAQTPPIVYTMAAPYATGTWPGAVVYERVGGEYTDELSTVASGDAVSWGVVAELLGYSDPNLWDRLSSLTVTMNYGTLTGCTEADIDADPERNLAAIGGTGRWELVNFTTATLTAPGAYTVSGFKRGRRGTEWAAEDHLAGDLFVLVDGAQDVAMGLSDVGTDLSFKTISSGRTTGFTTALTPYTGASLKPYAPCHLNAVKQTNGDWIFTWVRRTRVGGAWTSGTSIPLSEASEAYELDLGDGVTTVTKSISATSTYTWTQASQITDTGAEVMAGDLEWSAVQISDAVGRGFIAAATA